MTTTTITLNVKAFDVADGATILDLLDGRGRGSAVVVDDEIVPRSDWPGYRLRPGQDGRSFEREMTVDGKRQKEVITW